MFIESRYKNLMNIGTNFLRLVLNTLAGPDYRKQNGNIVYSKYTNEQPSWTDFVIKYERYAGIYIECDIDHHQCNRADHFKAERVVKEFHDFRDIQVFFSQRF